MSKVSDTVQEITVFNGQNTTYFQAGLGILSVLTVHVPLSNLNLFKSVQQSRHHELKPYCPNMYTVVFGLLMSSQRFFTRFSTLLLFSSIANNDRSINIIINPMRIPTVPEK